MSQNRGKQFETVVKKSFEKVPDANVIRLHDQTNGFKASYNPCDFIVYKYPYQYCIEVKSVHGNTLPLSNITKYQRKSLLQMSNTKGIIAGVVCWWIDYDLTKYIPIQLVQHYYERGFKSIRYYDEGCIVGCKEIPTIELQGKKKKVFFDYDMEKFFKEVSQ